MKILLTGATGYIGKRLLPVLAMKYDEIVCCVRDKDRSLIPSSIAHKVTLVEVDFLDPNSLSNIPKDIQAGYYLIHSMSSTSKDFSSLEIQAAHNFREYMDQTDIEHVIYLSGMTNEHELSEHLRSRKAVEDELNQGKYALTTLRAGIIIGSGSASFEIIRDLVEKLPIMIAPKWLHTRCQPIGIRDVVDYLDKTLLKKELYHQNFDIGGSDILTYKEMLQIFAEVRGLKRYLFIVPVMTPRLSSYWLFFVTSTTYSLAVALVDSMKVEVVCRNQLLAQKLDIQPLSYRESLQMAFTKISQNAIVSSWKDSLISGRIHTDISEFINVPRHGCFIDQRQLPLKNRKATLNRIWSIGGTVGWYYGNWLWKLRGYLDKLSGGVGLRRGRTNVDKIETGDVIDFWRVIYANKHKGKLLLYAEMKLPGDAWLEFNIEGNKLIQTATFRPRGIFGRLYWYAVLPFHGFIFNGMLRKLIG